ncbi:MAG: NAD-dependent epimerase/dehydratase family protein [Eubacterium sp.]|nr:NAD-dependent epimerase/dehydratase family protein [Eubacterium sp.]
MNILAAGGAGFIGSHLIKELMKAGHFVICADKLEMGSQNIRSLLDKGGNRFRFYKMDLAEQENVSRMFRENKIDAVYHLAANSDIQKGGVYPETDFHNTFLTTKTILEGMRENGVKKLFFASTSAVYGEMPDTELSETTGGLKPVSYYGGAKLASEAFISSYASMCDMSAVIFRFPNVIGPGLTHGVIYDFIRKLDRNPKELEILGDGTQCKPYIYVSDLIEAVLQVTQQWNSGLEIYNLSVNGKGTAVSEIAEAVFEELGLKDVNIHYTGGDRGWKGDVPKFQYDISKILSVGWLPEYSSDEAVRQSIRDEIAGRSIL